MASADDIDFVDIPEKFIFNECDMKPSMYLLCVDRDVHDFTLGNEYIIEHITGIGEAILYTDIGESISVSLQCIRYFFVPIYKLNTKELFFFKMSGKLQAFYIH